MIWGMTAAAQLARGLAAFEREAWAEAYEQLSDADRAGPLAPEHLGRLAVAAYLVGEDAASAAALSRAHFDFVGRGDPLAAAQSAFWLAFQLIDRPGQQAQANGWIARARGLLDERSEACVEQGFLQFAQGFQSVMAGQLTAAQTSFEQAAAIGRAFRNEDLIALARHGEGRALARMGRVADGLAVLDEVMVAVTAGQVGPIVSGVVYCSVISACHDVFDYRRAQEWTGALARWCEAHPDMVPFRGQCLIRRSELLQWHGAWPAAMDEVHRATRLFERTGSPPDTGAAYYQEGELYRIRGLFDEAERAYRQASQTGRPPQPGLALLRLAQNQTDAANASIRRALEDARAPRSRALILRAAVTIFLAAGDKPEAETAAGDLQGIANGIGAHFLHAAASQATGAVALATGDARRAAENLRAAIAIWRELNAPYEIALARGLLGAAERNLGDEEGAELEFDAALEVFDRLGAAPDAARITAERRAAGPRTMAGSLTGREVEVLRLVATGKTNRAIAEDLSISEKTVARHIANIFTKLDLSSRSAATAYAYEHKLL
jgi:DNA-binding CsgD family transcriptional regulator